MKEVVFLLRQIGPPSVEIRLRFLVFDREAAAVSVFPLRQAWRAIQVIVCIYPFDISGTRGYHRLDHRLWFFHFIQILTNAIESPTISVGGCCRV